MPADDGAPMQQTLTPWRVGPWLFGLLLLAALIIVVLRAGELERFVQLARAATPEWLLLALALQLATYACTASVWRSSLAGAGARYTLRSLIPLSLAKVFIDQLLPSGGLSGAVILVRGLARRGIDAAIAGQTLLVALVSYYSAYLIAVLAALAVLWLDHQTKPALVVAGAIVGALAVGTFAAVALLRRRGVPPEWLTTVPDIADLFTKVATAPSTLLRDKRLLAVTISLQLGVFALDTLTLWAIFFALSQPIGVVTTFATFMAASLAATIGPIPLGLGTFEGTAVVLLHVLGVEMEAALAATLLLRGLTFWLPMVPGLWLARREMAALRPETEPAP